MASELRVDTLKDSSGSNSVGMAYVAGTGTIATRDTLNISSVTDNGTGIYTANLSSSMSDANYSIGFTQGGANSVDIVKVYNSSTVQTASLFKLLSLTSGFAPVDSNYLYTSVHGDLA
jgi:hypothetical protein